MTPPTPAEALAAALHETNPISSVAHIAAGVNDPHGFLDVWDEEHAARHQGDAERILAALAASGWQVTAIEQAGSLGGASAGTESSPVSTTPPDTLRDEGLRAALERWQEEYAEIEEFTGDDGSVERFMTQLNHGNDEYDLRLEVIRQARAALASGEDKP